MNETNSLRFYGGTTGALTPFAVFLGGVGWLAFSGAPDERGFWPILIAGLALGLLLAKDRAAYAETVIDGMSQPIVMIMVMAWLLAGVFGSVMNASGFIEGLVWTAGKLGVSGAGFVVASFLISCIVSTATGTKPGHGVAVRPSPLSHRRPAECPSAGAHRRDPRWRRLRRQHLAGFGHHDRLGDDAGSGLGRRGAQPAQVRLHRGGSRHRGVRADR